MRQHCHASPSSSNGIPEINDLFKSAIRNEKTSGNQPDSTASTQTGPDRGVLKCSFLPAICFSFTNSFFTPRCLAFKSFPLIEQKLPRNWCATVKKFQATAAL
jgi:hypothetical protein